MDNVEPIGRERPASQLNTPPGRDPVAPGSSLPAAEAHGAAPGGTLIGRIVGDYRVEARIGGGAMASVYRGVALHSGAPVALKILLADADDTVRERFRLEAHMVSTLDHPHIVHTLDVSPTTGDDGLTFIAMELVEGQSLGDLLDHVHTLNVADSCALLAPIARALTYAHSRNVVHRDVKPSNILLRKVAPGTAHALRLTVLDDPVVPLLSDFGIARALDAPDLTSAGRTIGTPAYMSPEQCAGSREIDGRADIYALGAVLYRCLIGRSPYTGTTTQILYAHVYDPLTIPDNALRLLSPLMVEILRRSMAKDPNDRYRVAGELAADLGVGAGGPGRLPAIAGGKGPDPAYGRIVAGPMTEQTMTLPEMESAPAPREALRVIIPAPTVTPAGQLPRTVTPAARPPAPAQAARMPAASAAPYTAPLGAQTRAARFAEKARRQSARLRWRGVMVGLALAIPMFILLALGVGALLDFGPLQLARSAETATGTPPVTLAATIPSPQPSAIALLPAATVLVPTATAPAPEKTVQETPIQSPAEATPAPALTQSPAASATPGPTPAGDINAYWQEAQQLYGDEEWSQAAAFLTLVQRISPEFERVRVDSMLSESYLRVALRAFGENNQTVAANALQQIAALRPDDAVTQSLAQSAAALAERPTDGGAIDALRAGLATESARRLAANDPCAAAETLEASLAVARTVADPQILSDDVNAATAVRSQCTLVQQAQSDADLLATLPGRLLYSTQVGADDYRIYSANATAGSAAGEVIANGRQPALSPVNSVIAFHSTRPDIVGIAGLDINAAGNADARPTLLTRNMGDAVDSPPSWSGDGRELVFASVNPADQRSRIYTVIADGRDTPQGLRPGISPAWNPAADLIVYNGTDDQGQQPGLWLMRTDGSDPTPLTANGADNRPVWSPDGGTIAFMSNGRSSDWDVYTLDLASGAVMQLTTEASQDGLPTISPDGQYVAFVSDRGGNWNIWVKPLAGGRSLLLAPIEGSLTNWLEHALQWIP
jgi:serine/threonine-protein kinase